jgi:hypothetical protein
LAHTDRVLALVAEMPDMTIEELRCRLAARGVQTSRSALGRFLQGQGLTRNRHAAEQDRPDVAAPRRAWRERQLALSPERLVFIAETDQPGQAPRPRAARAAARGRCAPWPLEDAHLPRRAAA